MRDVLRNLERPGRDDGGGPHRIDALALECAGRPRRVQSTSFWEAALSSCRLPAFLFSGAGTWLKICGPSNGLCRCDSCRASGRVKHRSCVYGRSRLPRVSHPGPKTISSIARIATVFCTGRLNFQSFGRVLHSAHLPISFRFLAGYIPARRAGKIDPAECLRTEWVTVLEGRPCKGDASRTCQDHQRRWRVPLKSIVWFCFPALAKAGKQSHACATTNSTGTVNCLFTGTVYLWRRCTGWMNVRRQAGLDRGRAQGSTPITPTRRPYFRTEIPFLGREFPLQRLEIHSGVPKTHSGIQKSISAHPKSIVASQNPLCRIQNPFRRYGFHFGSHPIHFGLLKVHSSSLKSIPVCKVAIPQPRVAIRQLCAPM